MTESAFEELLIRMEGESIDFKGKDYPNLVDEVKKVDFIKDTICMVNTPREGPAYLMTGVKKLNQWSAPALGYRRPPRRRRPPIAIH